jgi:CDP-diacylglycerol--serine O-phosphatidyltransferase
MSEGAPRPKDATRPAGRLGRMRARPRFEGLSFNRLIPNIMTMLGLCAGLVAIRFAIDGRWPQAAASIVVAGVIDGLDGRLARLLKATSRFGVAPALVLYLWTMNTVGPLGFLPCLLFAVCSALRLARFNASLDIGVEKPKPAYAYNFFTGVPAPAGAGCVLFPLFLAIFLAERGWTTLAEVVRHPALVACFLVAVGGLMVSTLPTWSFKNFKVPRVVVLPLLLGVGFYVALLVAEPWAALAAAGLIYLAMLPFSVRSYIALRDAAEERQG